MDPESDSAPLAESISMGRGVGEVGSRLTSGQRRRREGDGAVPSAMARGSTGDGSAGGAGARSSVSRDHDRATFSHKGEEEGPIGRALFGLDS